MLDAIQTLINGSLQSLDYDRTITCTIVDNSNRARGEYVVDDGSSTFIAYSDFTAYANNTSVYVTVPQGDYSNKKIILGRRTNKDTEYFNYVAPTESYVDITNNVLTLQYDNEGNEKVFSTLANGVLASKGPIYTWSGNYKGYDRLGIKASFKTYLDSLKPIAGSYGLYLKVLHCNEDTEYKTEQVSNFLFGQNEMYGNIYSFNTFFEQQAVYDISNFGIIKKIDIYLYQLQDFKSQIGNGKEIQDIFIPHQEENIIGDQQIIQDFEDNIFVSNLYLSFGYDLNSFTEDKVINYTLDSMEYSSGNTAEERKRKLQCRWVHKTQNGEIVSIYNQEGLKKYNSNLYWYHYVLDNEVESEYGGKYWEEIQNSKNIFNNIVTCQTTVQDEYYKSVIISLSSERLNYISNLKDDINTGNIWALNDKDIQNLMLEMDKYEENYDISEVNKILNNLLLNDLNEKQLQFINKALETWNSLPIYDQYESILTIHNTTMVQANLAVDLIQAITIEINDKDGRNGVYNIYGEDGQILNRTYSLERHKLILNYNSLLTGMTSFDGNGTEIVTWKIPLTNTMIQPPTEGIEYDSSKLYLDNVKDANGNNIPAFNNDGEYMYIRRVIGPVEQDIDIGGFYTKTTEQIFRIKDYYSAVGNNTIYCYVEKGGYTYGNSITLIFGTAGTNGTDYTFRIALDKNAEYNQQLLNATAYVYDYNNQQVEIAEFIKQDWLYPSYTKNDLFVSEIQNNKEFYIQPKNNNLDHYFNILKSTIRINEISNFLTTYTIIPWTSDIITYNHYEGPDRIIYNSQGTDPSYYKGKLKLYNHLDVEQLDIEWEIKIGNPDSDEIDSLKFYPSIVNRDGNYVLKVPSMYMKNNEACCLIAKKNGIEVWHQPLLIMQNSFSSALLNNWNGDLLIDEDNGTIMSPMIGAGRKNSDNSFSGVLMGDVTRANDSTILTGVYGYDHGVQSYSLTEDGKATLGSAGRGQIIFDGNKGSIESANHKLDSAKGMKIDLENGEIDSYNFKLKSRYAIIDSREDANNYFTIKGSGTSTQTTYIYENEKLATNSYNQIFGAGIQEEEVEFNDKTLMNVGNSSFYLQTLNFNNNPGVESGLKLDLSKNKLIANEGFTLRAINHMVKVTGDSIATVQYPEIYEQVHSKYDTINEDGVLKNYNHTLLENINTVNYKNYYFKLTDNSEYQNDWENVNDFELYHKTNLKTTIFTSELSRYYYKQDLDNVDLYETITSENFKSNNDIYEKRIEFTYSENGKKSTTLNTLYRKYTTSSLIMVPSITASEVVKGETYHYIKDNILQSTTASVAGVNKYYSDIPTVTNTYYYWQPSGTVTSSVPGLYKSFSYSGTGKYNFGSQPNGYQVEDIYTGSGDYMKGTLLIDATANEYPIKLQLGNETPFKLSWAGYLTTTKLNAIGGTIGRWIISNTDLSADNGKIRLVPYGRITVTYGDNDEYTPKTSTATENCGYITIGNSSSGSDSSKIVTYNSAVINALIKQQSSSEGSESVNNIVTNHLEGSFQEEDIGKYYKKNNSTYYKIVSTSSPYYETVYQGKGGIQLLSNGLVSIYKLYIQGGGGTWDGCARYSQYTIARNHTHTLSATASNKKEGYRLGSSHSSQIYACGTTFSYGYVDYHKTTYDAKATLSGNSNAYTLTVTVSVGSDIGDAENVVSLSLFRSSLTTANTNYQKLKQQYDDLKTDYDNYKSNHHHTDTEYNNALNSSATTP